MIATRGEVGDSDANADFRGQVCRYYDDRLTPGEKLAAIHADMGADGALLRMSFDRIERFLETLDPSRSVPIRRWDGARTTLRSGSPGAPAATIFDHARHGRRMRRCACA